MHKYTSALIPGLILALSSISSVNATKPCIPVLHLPLVINKSGYYCLVKDYKYTDNKNAITINASHVTLDLKQHKIELMPHNPSNKLYGVYSLNSHHIIIKNGKIRGFMYGVYLADQKGSNTGWNSSSGNYLIENLVLQNNFFRGIRVEGTNQILKNNKIFNTGGSLVFDNAFSIGIEIIGPRARIENNSILDTHAQGSGENIAISFSNNCAESSASGNQIFNHYSFLEKRAHYRGKSGHSFGIWVGGNPNNPSYVTAKNNRIKNFYYGIVYSSPTKGHVKDNKFEDVDRDLYLNGSVVVE